MDDRIANPIPFNTRTNSWTIEEWGAGTMNAEHGQSLERRPLNFAGTCYVILDSDRQVGVYRGDELFFAFKDEAQDCLDSHESELVTAAEARE